MKKNSILTSILMTFSCLTATADHVQKWDTFQAEKGYVLSIDLWNKQCKKIWSKQIPEFLERNKHIKDANLILIGQEITVQSCVHEESKSEEVVSQPVVQANKEEKKNDVQKYLTIYLGVNELGQQDDSTAKEGKSIGIKIGKEWVDGQSYKGLALGAFHNKSETVGDKSKGEFEVKTTFLNLEGHAGKKLTKRVQVGGLVNIVGANDVSLSEKDKNEKIGAFLGAEAIMKFSDKIGLETNLQHRIDKIKQHNLMLNVGLRMNF